MESFTIPNLQVMSDKEVKCWVESLSTPMVYAHLSLLTKAIMDRFGEEARISTYTYHPPKIVFLMEDSA